MFLVIDNYDSFTYNLVQYLGELSVEHQITRELIVKRNDEITLDEIIKLNPSGILLSPGPGNPDQSGICLPILKKLSKNIPTSKNFIVEFANSIGSVRRTNFGEYFDVKSKPDPNDLAYTSLALAPHTDNPYRNPVPCIQLLHCIESKVSGGLSSLVDGYTVTEELRSKFPEFYEILTEVKVRFKFIDKEVILENISPLIELNDDKSFKQVRFSPRLDYVPILDKEKLDLYYQARKKLSEMYNSEKYRIEFKLEPKDLIMMDNHRLLHGRTSYETKEGERFLQGCYIDFDSTEGKLRHLKRKFNL